MAIPELFEKLLNAAGPSGYESAPAAVWRQAAAEFASVESDTLGSSFATVEAKGSGPRLALFGHIDEIGLVVRHIDDNGFLYFDQVGGWDPQILIGQRVELLTKDGKLAGVIGKKPIHLLKPEERKKAAELSDLHIDIGVKDLEEAQEHVRLGDVAVVAAEPLLLPNGRVVSRALDNRVGAYVVQEAARQVAAAGGAPGEVVAVASVQEEITLGGARTSAYGIDPDLAIVVDVTFESSAPGIDTKEIGKHEFGSGPVLGRGSTLHPALFELLYETAKAEDIPFTISASGRYTGTDADIVNLTKAGIPTTVVSVPLRYMHSPVEMIQLEDLERTASLIAKFALKLDQLGELKR